MADAKKKKVVGPVKRPDNFDELEKEFETVLNELLNDESLEKFKKQYEKLHTALVNSHESERALMDKIRDLNEEISTNAEKVSTALKLSKDDEARITSLTGELEGAWKKVEYLKQREQWSKETISALQQEIEQLNQLVQKGADLAVQFQSSEPSGYMPLGKVEGRVGTGTKDSGQPGGTDGSGGQDHLDGVEDLKMRVQELDSEKSRLQEMVNTTMTEVRQKTMELQRERTRRMNAENDNRSKAQDLESKTTSIQDLTRQLNTAQELVNSQESTLRELRVSCELSSKEIESLTGRLQKVQSEMEKQSGLVDTLQMEVNEQSNTLRLKDDKLFKLTDSVKKLTKAKEMATRKLKKLTEQRASLRHEKEQLHGQLTVATKTIDANKKTREQDQMHINGLMHERDLINKNLVKQVKATEKQANLVSLHEQTCQNMGHEIMGFHREAEKQRRIIQQLEKERDRYINENGDLNMKLMKNMEELKMRDLRILDQKKRGEELECRLKVQQNLYEAVHQDRNTYSRLLIECQDEMNEMKTKLRMLEHQSHQLKEEVAAREQAVVKEHMECLRLEKEKDGLVGEVQMLKNQLREVQTVVTDLRAEEKNLQKVIADSDEIIKRQKRELDAIISERDILGSQLVRRNDELSLVYQKVKLLQTLLNNGNRMYDERIEDIRVLRMEVKRLRHENQCLKKGVANVVSYKQELYSVHREVLHERARCAALELELSHPRQIHRWRGMEISDPSRFELLQKVQALQKRLINRTEEVVEVERVVQEKDRLYLELRALLERQPGPEVANQISSYQRVLKSKNRQMKTLVAEQNMLESDNKLSDYNKQKQQLELVDLKKKYFKEKKRSQDLQARLQFHIRAQKVSSAEQIQGLPTVRTILPADRFVGGGFRVTQYTSN